jgi:hypothetical protein
MPAVMTERMQRWLTVSTAIVGSAATAAVAAVALGVVLWDRHTARAIDRLPASSSATDSPAPAVFARGQLAELPAPVVRYFELVLTPGQPVITRARIRWEGEFLIAPGRPWSPFTAEQHYAVRPPGFVWDARIRMVPLVPTRVRDAYVDGTGMLEARVAALIPVAYTGGTPEMAAGELSRFLGEAVWLPTALLPAAGVRWDAIDDSTARATLTDRGTTVSLDVHFGAGGEIVRVSTLRHRAVNGTLVLTPWSARVGGYRRVHGMLIPGSGEAEWVLPNGSLPYWRGRPVDVQYELAR